MTDVLGYQGKDVVITGAASGMGKAAAQLLVDAGANVYALDIAEVSVEVKKVIKVDMKNQESLDEALSQLPESIYAHFNCAGVPSPPFSSDDAVLINFAGLRYLTESLIPRIVDGGAIASIASTAGMGWKHSLDLINDFLAIDNSIVSARKWLSEHVDAFPDGYSFSKSCMIVYTMSMAKQLAETLLFGNLVPVDEELVEINFTFFQPLVNGEAPKGGVQDAIIKGLIRQLEEDKIIWEKKVHRDAPALCDGDGPIARFRRYYSQFYAE
jgi:NAD(P)-dependent dehydrogenase (short-subunit alcohol dehydrogenase family)